MADSILVALNQTQLIDQFMPYLKLNAEPGTKLVFLVRTETSNWGNVEGHLPMVETGSITGREYRETAWRFNIDREKERAERKLASACAALRRKGVNPEVKMYAGSLSKALREYSKAGAPRLIIRAANYSFIKVFKNFLAALKLSAHHDVPSLAGRTFRNRFARVQGTFVLKI
jgi:hypothetical protein